MPQSPQDSILQHDKNHSEPTTEHKITLSELNDKPQQVTLKIFHTSKPGKSEKGVFVQIQTNTNQTIVFFPNDRLQNPNPSPLKGLIKSVGLSDGKEGNTHYQSILNMTESPFRSLLLRLFELTYDDYQNHKHFKDEEYTFQTNDEVKIGRVQSLINDQCQKSIEGDKSPLSTPRKDPSDKHSLKASSSFDPFEMANPSEDKKTLKFASQHKPLTRKVSVVMRESLISNINDHGAVSFRRQALLPSGVVLASIFNYIGMLPSNWLMLSMIGAAALGFVLLQWTMYATTNHSKEALAKVGVIDPNNTIYTPWLMNNAACFGISAALGMYFIAQPLLAMMLITTVFTVAPVVASHRLHKHHLDASLFLIDEKNKQAATNPLSSSP